MRFLIIGLALLSVASCGKNEVVVKPPPDPLAWAEGHYMCDRLNGPPGKQVSTGEINLTVVKGAVRGKVRQLTANSSGLLPETIAVNYEFSGPVTLGADGKAVFDISGQIPLPTPGPFHVVGEIRPNGTIGAKAKCTIEFSVAELEKPKNVEGAPNPQFVPKKFIKKQFAMEGEGIGLKR
ncbi:MAG: hypothetical protein H0V44_13760 [Planctomycetes bacterium]|nr:hypothetical protein [Planctomycetota bacterium]